jgi:hypothetical protein
MEKKTTIIMKNKNIINMIHDQYMITSKDTNNHLGLQVIFILNLILVCLSVHCHENDQLQNSPNNLDQYDQLQLAYLIITVFPTGMLALLRKV